jgi:hypothetical protein
MKSAATEAMVGKVMSLLQLIVLMSSIAFTYRKRGQIGAAFQEITRAAA